MDENLIHQLVEYNVDNYCNSNEEVFGPNYFRFFNEGGFRALLNQFGRELLCSFKIELFKNSTLKDLKYVELVLDTMLKSVKEIIKIKENM